MSISSLVSQTAATNPMVGAAVAKQSMQSALLYSAQTGDAATSTLLSALSTQAVTEHQLLSSVASSSLGQNLDVKA